MNRYDYVRVGSKCLKGKYLYQPILYSLSWFWNVYASWADMTPDSGVKHPSRTSLDFRQGENGSNHLVLLPEPLALKVHFQLGGYGQPSGWAIMVIYTTVGGVKKI